MLRYLYSICGIYSTRYYIDKIIIVPKTLLLSHYIVFCFQKAGGGFYEKTKCIKLDKISC